MDFDVLKPILETVDREFLRPVMGAEMHNKLLEFYNSSPDQIATPEPDPPVSPTLEEIATATAKLLKLAQTAEIHHVHGIPAQYRTGYIVVMLKFVLFLYG